MKQPRPRVVNRSQHPLEENRMTHTPAGRRFHYADSHNNTIGWASVNDWIGDLRNDLVGA